MQRKPPAYIGSRDEYKATFTSMLQLLLYLCSDEPDMPEIERPRRTVCGGARPAEVPRVWDIGVRVSQAMRSYRRQGSRDGTSESVGQGSHASPRPHIRSAHWQSFWVGLRTATFPERRPVIHWIPPVPVGMDWKRELPTNIRRVV